LNGDHPTGEILDRLRLRTLAGQDLLDADDHVSRCDSCRSATGDSAQTSENARKALEALDEDHLSFEEMSSYADGLGDADERAAMAMHVEACAMCRSEVNDLAETFSLSPPRGEGRGEGPPFAVSATSHWRRYAMAAILAAVVVGGSAILWNLTSGRPQGRQPVGTARNVPPPSPATRPATPDPLAGLNPSLRRVARNLDAGTLASAALIASLQGKQGRQRSTEVASDSIARVLEPVGKVIESDRPTFRWSRPDVAAVAVVQVFDGAYNLVLESPEVQESSWTSPSKLKRGITYRWQLVLRAPAGETTVPTPPDPPAQFRVLGAKALAELNNARRSGSELEAGLICMREGLFEEGSRRISAFAKAHPGSAVSRLAEKTRIVAQRASAASSPQ
jgi:hypothetical protein